MRALRALEAGRRLKHYAGIAAGSLGLSDGRPLAGPLHAQIGISDPCNHRCVFCWDHPPAERESESTQDRFGAEKPGLMALDTFRGIVDDLHALGTRRIDLVGRGEPLLNRSVLEMVRYAKERGMYLVLCSNASMLSRAHAEALVATGLDRLNVSLNAGTAENYPNNHVTETPDDYRRVKANLRALVDVRTAADSRCPHLRLSFVISAKNYFELDAMVRVAHEVGADEVRFEHAVVHDGSKDIALRRDQYAELLAAIPAVRASAEALGVETNLSTFAAFVPTYLDAALVGPRVVPCYVGYYFSVVLGNGSVMPCCQCASPVGRVEDGRRFADAWRSEGYREFRRATRALPAASPALASCECDRCMLRPRNISIHNFLHPWDRIDGGEDDQLFTVADLMRLRKRDRA